MKSLTSIYTIMFLSLLAIGSRSYAQNNFDLAEYFRNNKISGPKTSISGRLITAEPVVDVGVVDVGDTNKHHGAYLISIAHGFKERQIYSLIVPDKSSDSTTSANDLAELRKHVGNNVSIDNAVLVPEPEFTAFEFSAAYDRVNADTTMNHKHTGLMKIIQQSGFVLDVSDIKDNSNIFDFITR